MLILRLNDLKNSALERRVSAQVLCLDDEGDSYCVTGLIYADGKSLGVLISHNGQDIRRWARTDYIWRHILKFVGTKLATMNVIQVCPENAKLVDLFIHAFELDKPTVNEYLDNDRRDTLAKLAKALTRGTTRDSPDS